MPCSCSTASRCTLAACGTPARQLRQFEVMRGEQRIGSGSARCRWRAIAQASARPSKVEVPRPISSISTRLVAVASLQDGGRFGHFHHEGGTAAGEVVGGADAREDPVDRAEARALRRHEGCRTCASSAISAVCRM